MENDIVIKGKKEGLEIILNDKDSIDVLCEKFKNTINTSRSFFAQNNMFVTFTGRNFKPGEKKILIDLAEKMGFNIKYSYNVLPDNEEIFENNDTCFVRKIIRSGQSLYYKGNIVIVGDVNPGGEISATGNIVVLGTLKGSAYAGVDNDYNAFIAATTLEPLQLGIGDLISYAPDTDPKTKLNMPEIALIRDKMIVIEPYKTLF